MTSAGKGCKPRTVTIRDQEVGPAVSQERERDWFPVNRPLLCCLHVAAFPPRTIFHDRLKTKHRSCFHEKFIYDFLHMKTTFSALRPRLRFPLLGLLFIGFYLSSAALAAEFLAVEGHLTKDAVLDKVSLSSPCGECWDWDKEENPKLGFTVTLNRPPKKPLKLEAPNALCFRCGGVKGAPITGQPQITKGKLLQISYNGGSREYWTHVMKWRFDEATETLELIGYTGSSVDTLQEDPKNFAADQVGNLISMDINYRTRKIEKKVVGKNLKAKLHKCELSTDFKSPSFATFSYEDFDSGGDQCGEK